MTESQQLIQMEQTFLDRLAKISPTWAKHLLDNPHYTTNEDNMKYHEYGGEKINILNGSYCVVGEAHGFPKYPIRQILSKTMYHNCNTCYKFSTKLLAKTRPELEEVLNSFMNHWEKSHQ